MGCDGGTIPRRDELVRLKKKPEQKDKDAERSFKWRNCALSQQPLQQPIVACGLGKLYSKSSVLEALLDKETKPESMNHIKNLKDIKDLKLVNNPAYKATDHSEGTVGDGNAPYICPISGLEMSGKFRFVFLWTCGCVLAERALKEVKQNLCHMCQHPFTDTDVVILNGSDEDIKTLHQKMTVRVASRKSTKKSKADKIKVETITEPATPSTSATPEIIAPQMKEEIPVKKEPEVRPSTTVNKDSEAGPSNAVKKEYEAGPSTVKKEYEAGPSTVKKEYEAGPSTVKKESEVGSSTAVKREMETIPLSLPKYNPNKQARGHFGSSKRVHTTELAQDPSYKKTKKDYSVAKDPQTSEVYKSLFTSHSSDQSQKRAHWVTYNPFYN